MRWRTVRLGELVEIIKGKKPSVVADFPSVEAPAPYVTIEAFEFGKPVQYASVDDNGVTVRNGDVVIVWDGARFGMVGNAIEGVLGSTLAVLRPKECSLNADFLRYFLTTKNQELQCSKRGSGIPHLDPITVKNLPIPLPPLDEQRRIVEILDQADRLRKLRCQADAIAERILPALFYKMFGDPVRNEKGWEKETLGSLSVLGPQYGANASSIKWEPGMARYVRITDINDDGSLRNDELRSLDTEDWEEFVLYDGDIVFARSGATVGKAYIHRGSNYPHVFAGYLIRFRLDPSRVNPWVVFGLTQTSYYRAWVAARKRTAAQPNINGQEYATLMIPVPPKELQEEYATLVERILKMQTQQKASSRTVEDLFTSLLHRAFTGELTKRWREEQKVV